MSSLVARPQQLCRRPSSRGGPGCRCQRTTGQAGGAHRPPQSPQGGNELHSHTRPQCRLLSGTCSTVIERVHAHLQPVRVDQLIAKEEQDCQGCRCDSGAFVGHYIELPRNARVDSSHVYIDVTAMAVHFRGIARSQEYIIGILCE